MRVVCTLGGGEGGGKGGFDKIFGFYQLSLKS